MCDSTSSLINKIDFIDALVVSEPRSLVHLQHSKMNEGATGRDLVLPFKGQDGFMELFQN